MYTQVEKRVDKTMLSNKKNIRQINIKISYILPFKK